MTVTQPARPAPAAPGRVPFPTVDEVSLHCTDPVEPETVHIELHFPGRFEPERLRTALAEAARRHPRFQQRKAASRWWHRRYQWQVTPEADVDPVAFLPAGPSVLEAARERTMTDCPPLDAAPPVRIEAVETGDGGTVLMTTVNHTAMDGPSCLRVLATAAEVYAGGEPQAAASAGGKSPARTGPKAAAAPPAPPPADAGRPGPARPARIAGDTSSSGSPGTGNGLLLLDLPAPRRTSYGATVNDQLLVATCLTAARWNRAHGARTAPVRITMPVDNRARESAEMLIGNGTRLTEVGFGPEERADAEALTGGEAPDRAAVERLLRATMARTHTLKSEPSHPLGLYGVLLTAPVLPVGVRGVLARTLRSAAAPLMSTTLLSNLGRIVYPLDFGAAGRPTAVWVSAPSRMPRGLAITAASTAGRLHLAVRYSRALLDHAAAVRIGELMQQGLAACAEDPGDPA
ncbi:condensation protein [Streptomyces sp. CMB-StM0423]|uniref:condensation protein n=1 Tax=Streptomyces sp. CMB-StM0423 TaxID=2059884 RepID=UPI000C712614|nr:condensation protein [Streptomyces sp. CMB-StM0423]AUH43200.1 condensation protein [Streptomyces sp. CMB-StM0423]